jgi:maltose O-acetyltransferase
MVPDGRSMHERMLAGDPYVAEGPEIARDAARALRLTREFNDADPTDAAALRDVLERLLGGLGPGSEIRQPLRCDYGYRTTIGARCFVNFGLVCLDVAPVTIGDDTMIGPGVQLLTATHPLDADLRREKLEGSQPIVIGRNVWIGGGAIVLPGVTIGDDVVVGAGSVVTKDLPAGVVAVGSPARAIEVDRERDAAEWRR